MSTHLYALIMHLHPTEDIKVPAMLGTQAHAAFLSMIRQHEPALAGLLHNDHGPDQPFGVSLLVPSKALIRRKLHVQAGKVLKLRITLRSSLLLEAFMEYFLGGDYGLRIGQLKTLVGRVEVSGTNEPLAGYATMEQLFEQAQARPMQRLRFIMPTTWKTGNPRKYFELFPHPYPVFQKLSRTWAKWAPPELQFEPQPLLEALRSEEVIVNAYSLRTIHWVAKKPPTQGFIGSVQYEVNGDERLRYTIDLLCRFSFFAGLGNASGRGLGVVVPEVRNA